MNLTNLPAPLDNIFADTQDLSVFFDRLMAAMVELLHCDRCYLYLRDPQFLWYKIPHCHCSDSNITNLKELEKQTEPIYLAETNPLFAAAKNCESPIFIENMDEVIANSKNSNFWQQNHQEQKALLQVHLCLDNNLWGIIQASQFNRPRPWTKFDRNLISQIVDRITPLVSVYARRELRETVQYLHDGNC